MGVVDLGAVQRPHRVSNVSLTLASAVIGLVTTALIIGTPYLVFGYRSPTVHIVLDSVAACIALLVALLVGGRYQRSRRLQDLLLAEGLVFLAIALLVFPLLVDLTGHLTSGTLAVWLVLSIRLCGALLIAAASLAGSRHGAPRTRRLVSFVPPVVTAVICLLLVGNAAALPVALEQSPPTTAQNPVIAGHLLLVTAQGLIAVCFIVAAVGFTIQSSRRRDELLRWVGPAFAMAAFARVNYFLFPSLFTDWVYTGDLLRTGSYLLLLVGATREIRQYWHGQAMSAVMEDRRRLARELHDGVIQELGYIRSLTFSLTADDESARQIHESCQRGLDEARAALHALESSGREPLSVVLTKGAQQIADRYAARLELDIDESMSATPAQQHELLRICREAISNAVRHGGATHVRVRLRRDGDGWQLRIRDDGRGFNVLGVVASPTGFGLTSMNERALALPGSFSVQAAPQQGTTVTVRW